LWASHGGVRLQSAMTLCAYPVIYGTLGMLSEPRPCKRDAVEGPYCAQHARVAKRRPVLRVHDGGFCIWCAAPGRTYARDGVQLALCGPCGNALYYELCAARRK
jgi:hypothetical protein